MKITEAMKLVAAAKVRRAQEAVVNGRPFAENLIKVCRNRMACDQGWLHLPEITLSHLERLSPGRNPSYSRAGQQPNAAGWSVLLLQPRCAPAVDRCC